MSTFEIAAKMSYTAIFIIIGLVALIRSDIMNDTMDAVAFVGICLSGLSLTASVITVIWSA